MSESSVFPWASWLLSLLFAALAVTGAEVQRRSLLGEVDAFPVALSLALGGAVAAVMIFVTRRLLQPRRGKWVQEWIDHLGGSLATSTIASALATAAAAVSEELFFRGLLLPWLGLVVSSLLFGAVHLVGGGRARWTWALAATLLGLALGEVTVCTGSLAGALVAHVLVNLVNAPRVREAYARARARPGTIGRRSGGKPLGGLLRPKS